MTLRPYPLPMVAMLLALAACASSSLDPIIEERTAVTQGRMEAAQAPGPIRSSDPLTVSDSVWLGDRVVRLPRGTPLPAELEAQDGFTLRADRPLQLGEIGGIISSQTNIPFSMTNGAEEIAEGTTRPAAANDDSGGNNPASPLTLTTGMRVSYQGPLSGLLDMVGAYFNVSWTYNGVSLEFSRYQTRTFVMDALPGAIAMTAAEGGAELSPQLLATANIDIWDDINRTLGNIVGSSGSVDISQSSGTVIVSTTIDRMERVSRYLEEENRRLSRQVAISVELYTVEVSDSSAYGLDLTAALASIDGLPSINLAGPPAGLSTDATPGSVTINLVEPNELAGTNGVVQALATLGKTTRLAQIPITTLNNRPANQSITLETNYVSGVTSTSSGVDNVSTEIETDTQTTGISVSVLPRIMSDGRILLQYGLTQSDLIDLARFTSGTSVVQLPNTQDVSFSQQVMMKNGSTLVLAGFDQSSDGNDATGLGRPLSWLLGGSNTSVHSRRLTVIAITPREIQITRREAS